MINCIHTLIGDYMRQDVYEYLVGQYPVGTTYEQLEFLNNMWENLK
jgi:hypothetical protein